jgi:flavin-dependent dehydrogenase
MLARHGVRVALIDGSHPREKPCGGGLTGRALELVDHLVPWRSIPGVLVRSARFLDSSRGREALVPLDEAKHALLVASRSAFDGALFDAARHAGAVCHLARVATIARGRRHVLTTTNGERIETPFIIGADGANSFVRRRFATAFRRDQLSVAAGVYVHGVTSDEIVLEITNDPPGYIWSFPRPDHLAIGIGAQADETTVGTVRAALLAWIARTGIAQGGRLEPYAWPIPSLHARDFDRMQFAGDGWMTVGDAAGLVDPITREGIFFAIQSALFAAEAFARNPVLAAEHYADRVRDEIVPELRQAATLKTGFFRPRFTRLLVDALGASPRIRAVMADLAAGTQSYRTLKRRLIGTGEFRLAWEWLRLTQRAS